MHLGKWNFFLYNCFLLFGCAGLCCCMWALPGCGGSGYAPVSRSWLLLAVLLLLWSTGCGAHRLQQLQLLGSEAQALSVVAHRLSRSQAWGIFLDQPTNHVSPALTGRFFTSSHQETPVRGPFAHGDWWEVSTKSSRLMDSLQRLKVAKFCFLYCQLLHDIETKNTPWGKDSLFSKQCLENLDSRRQKNEMDHCLTPYTKIKTD